MPYGLKMRGARHCVVKTDTGEVVKCHPTHGAALAHQRALTLNVKARELVGNDVKRLVDLEARDLVHYTQETTRKLREETHALDEG